MSETTRNITAEAELRAKLYRIALDAFAQYGYTAEPIKGGSLITIDDNTHCKLAISVCDESKVGDYLAIYAEQQEKNAEKLRARAEKLALEAEEKARKAQARAEKKTKKEEE